MVYWGGKNQWNMKVQVEKKATVNGNFIQMQEGWFKVVNAWKNLSHREDSLEPTRYNLSKNKERDYFNTIKSESY